MPPEIIEPIGLKKGKRLMISSTDRSTITSTSRA
jgi:hypothetical protein